MRFRLTALSFILLFATLKVCAQNLHGTVLFYPQISTQAAYADGTLKHFSAENIYKTLSVNAQLPFTVHLANNFFADFNYFARADYSTNNGAKTDYTHKFEEANINYRTDNIYFKLGRQHYAPQGKENFIYYGPARQRDNILPSALEGISHGGQNDFIAYDILLAKEVKSLSPFFDNSTVYGAQANLNLGRFFNFDAFYYARQTQQNEEKINLSLYGGAVNFVMPQSLRMSVYGALNGGSAEAQINPFISINNTYDGYALKAEIETQAQNDFADNTYTFNVFYGSAQTGKSMPFTPISGGEEYGFVFGGGNIPALNSFGASAGAQQNLLLRQDMLVYSFGIKIAPQTLQCVNFDMKVYNFLSTAKQTDSKNLGSEADFKLSYASPRFEAALTYGVFVSGNGLGKYSGANVSPNKTVNKVGISAGFAFY